MLSNKKRTQKSRHNVSWRSDKLLPALITYFPPVYAFHTSFPVVVLLSDNFLTLQYFLLCTYFADMPHECRVSFSDGFLTNIVRLSLFLWWFSHKCRVSFEHDFLTNIVRLSLIVLLSELVNPAAYTSTLGFSVHSPLNIDVKNHISPTFVSSPFR